MVPKSCKRDNADECRKIFSQKYKRGTDLPQTKNLGNINDTDTNVNQKHWKKLV